MVDTHIHLSRTAYDNEFPYLVYDEKIDGFLQERGTRESLISHLMQKEFSYCIEPGVELESNMDILKLSEQYAGFVFPAIGIHPTRVFDYYQGDSKSWKRLYWRQRETIRELAVSNRVIAIGETGLDYHLDRKSQHRLRQVTWFVWQIRLADELGLPLILHIRDAYGDAIRILKVFKKKIHGGVCHCFSSGVEHAEVITDLGIAIGIGGRLLQDKYKAEQEEVVRITPITNILIETDGPYVLPDCPLLSGKQKKKTRNSSLILPAVIKRIAELKEMPADKVAESVTKNSNRIFRI